MLYAPNMALKQKTLAQDRDIGMKALLGVDTTDYLKLAKKVESGLPFDTFERVGRVSGLSTDDLRSAIRIAPRTLTRRRIEKRLSPEESDRLVSVSRLLSHAIELFEGDVKAALNWFTSKNRALSGISPLNAASTEIGSREVEALIGRLEHGVFA
jgi:putative toxin-antitoxin system antitoxin component (TIGR02293 family)